MAKTEASTAVKAFVLLREEEYLKENISNPVSYFHALRKEGVFSREQCKEIEASGAQMNKFVELISTDQRGYDVFIKTVKKLRVDGHIASYLKRKVDEAAKLGISDSHELLSEEQRQTLTMMKFMTHTRIGHDVARDILSTKSWDLPDALEAVKNMGYSLFTSDECVTPFQGNFPSSSTCSLSDNISSMAGAFSSLPDGSGMNSTTGSSRNSPVGDLPCLDDTPSADYHHEVGPLPPLPSSPLSSSISHTPCAEYHPKVGALPPLPTQPLPSSPSPPTPLISSASAIANTGTQVGNCSRARVPANLPHGKSTCQPSSRTKHEITSQGKLNQDEDTLQLEVENCHALGSFWSCYHCSQHNANALELCVKCKMLFSHTNESWNNNTEGESVNYVCVSCDMGVRLPCKPCPQTLVNQLRYLQVCNMCFNARRSQFIDKGTQTARSILGCRPTMLLLQSMFNEDGKEICIIDEVASRWDALAPHLDIKNAEIKILQRDYSTNCLQACMKMFSLWIDRQSENLTWECLVEAVWNIHESVLAKNIESVCRYTLRNGQ